MSSTMEAGRALAEKVIADDLSLYVLGGRVTNPAQGLEDAALADEVGIGRVWLSERYDLKEAGALLGGMAAVTKRLRVATSAIAAGSRTPILTAALGATMQAAYGGRFTLGLGRGSRELMNHHGMREVGHRALADYADIVRRLWRGETVSYNGPAGEFPATRMVDMPECDPPEIWSVNLGGKVAAKWTARAFDGVFLTTFMTPEAVAEAIGWIHEECERIGRDPASVRICQPVVTAPELEEPEVRALAHARFVLSLQWPSIGEQWVARNRWDWGPAQRVREHSMFADMDESVTADQRFTREQVMEVTELIPESWMQETCAIGSLPRCVEVLQSFKDAGAHEIAFYGSRMHQNARLVDAWRAHRTKRGDLPAAAPARGES